MTTAMYGEFLKSVWWKRKPTYCSISAEKTLLVDVFDEFVVCLLLILLQNGAQAVICLVAHVTPITSCCKWLQER